MSDENKTLTQRFVKEAFNKANLEMSFRINET